MTDKKEKVDPEKVAQVDGVIDTVFEFAKNIVKGSYHSFVTGDEIKEEKSHEEIKRLAKQGRQLIREKGKEIIDVLFGDDEDKDEKEQ